MIEALRSFAARRGFAAGLVILALVGCAGSRIRGEGGGRSANHWLRNAANDEERYASIERQFRGFDHAMWETGERYRAMHDAIARANYDLALYHWDKIKIAIENGTERRPARRSNAEALFLSHWGDVRVTLEAREPARAWAGFDRATAACQSCHRAEGVAYMNEQPLFDLRRAPAD